MYRHQRLGNIILRFREALNSKLASFTWKPGRSCAHARADTRDAFWPERFRVLGFGFGCFGFGEFC